MATLNFATTDRKVFTPITTALSNLPNGPGTMMFLVHKTATGRADYGGLLNSALSTFYHSLSQTTAATLWDDDGVSAVTNSTTGAPNDTSNWWWVASDWGATAGTERFHWRNQTANASWNHASSVGNTVAAHAGPGPTGRVVAGYVGDETGTKDMALMAMFAGVRFSDSDYGLWTKTSDIYNHALGQPTFISELNTITPVDLTGNATYSSANSTGTTLTGADPDNWTLDGTGPPGVIAQANTFRNMRSSSRYL